MSGEHAAEESLRAVPADPPGAHVVVVGGGVGGLAAAWFLLRQTTVPVRVTVLEGDARLGGKLVVDDLGGVPVDGGGEAVVATRPEAVRLARDVGLGDDLVHPRATTASAWTRGALRPLPAGLVMGVPTDLRALAASGVLSVPGLLRVPLDHVLAPNPVEGDVSVGGYVAARLGREVVDRLVEPLLGGVYAGRASALSLEATVPALFREARRERSLLVAARRTSATASRAAGARRGPVFAGLAGGVGRLPGAVAAAVEAAGGAVETGAPVRELQRRPSGWRLLVGASAETARAVDADAVVLAVPAGAAAQLLARDVPGAAAELGAVEYSSLAVATLAYRATAAALGLRGSGFLVPPVDGHVVKGATFLTGKWEWMARLAQSGRADADRLVLVRASVGRTGEESVLRLADEDLVQLAAADIAAATGLPAAPVAWRLHRWPGALPQYAVGHVGRVARIRAGVSAVPGLVLCGAAYDGVGVAPVVGSARTAAQSLVTALAARRRWARA